MFNIETKLYNDNIASFISDKIKFHGIADEQDSSSIIFYNQYNIIDQQEKNRVSITLVNI